MGKIIFEAIAELCPIICGLLVMAYGFLKYTYNYCAAHEVITAEEKIAMIIFCILPAVLMVACSIYMVYETVLLKKEFYEDKK